MKYSTLFVVGHHPPYVHLASTRRHSRDRCSQAFPVFLPLFRFKPKNKNGGGLGMRLAEHCVGRLKKNYFKERYHSAVYWLAETTF